VRLKRDGYEPVPKRSRWCFLKRPEDLTERPKVKLSGLLRQNLLYPAGGAVVPAARGLPAALEVQEGGLGGEVPGRVDGPGDALEAGAEEGGRPDDPVAQTIDAEMAPGSG
jgi:hypothetical protein